MTIVLGLNQLCSLLLITGAAYVSINLLARGLRHAVPLRKVHEIQTPKTSNAPSASERDGDLPDFSPTPPQLMVRDALEPKPRSRQRATPSMFLLLLPSFCFAALPEPIQAQALATVVLPPLHVDAPYATCVDVEVEGERHPAFDCLNEQLKANAEGAAPSDPNTALNAVAGNGAPNKVGTFSYTGESIRMGNTFGKSAFPQRPAPPVYSNALTAGVK